MRTLAVLASVFACVSACGKSSKDSASSSSPPPPPPSTAPIAPAAPLAAPPDAPPTPSVPGSWYRAELTYSKGEKVPFFIWMPDAVEADGIIRNGEEQVGCRVTPDAGGVVVHLENAATSVIEAKRGAQGALDGSWTRHSPQWGDLKIPFHADRMASLDPTARFPGTPGAGTDVTGSWSFKYEKLGTAMARFEQTADGVVTGYIRVQNFGDSQHLAGNIRDTGRGTELFLSTFDGSNEATVYHFDVGKDGSLSGSYVIANTWREKLSGVRDDDVQLYDKITLRKGDDRALLKAVPELERYRGKPTLLFLFATWCPSCHDASVFLHDLYTKLHPKGLEVLALALDLTADPAEAKGDIVNYRQQNGIPWEIVPVLGDPEAYAGLRPVPLLEGFEAVPVMIFVDATGHTTAIQPGFIGPAGGRDHEALKAKLTAQAEALLSSR